MRETFFFGARRPHQQVLLLVGLTLLGLILFSVLGLLIAKKLFGLAWEGGQLPQAGTPGLLGGLRTLQFFQSVGTFVLPSVAFFLGAALELAFGCGLDLSACISALALGGLHGLGGVAHG